MESESTSTQDLAIENETLAMFKERGGWRKKFARAFLYRRKSRRASKGRVFRGKYKPDGPFYEAEDNEVFSFPLLEVNGWRISSIIVAVKDRDVAEKLSIRPNFVVHHEGRTELIFFLESPIPVKEASKPSRGFLKTVQNRIRAATGGECVQAQLCLNPFFPWNEARLLSPEPYTLMELRPIANEARQAEKQRQAEEEEARTKARQAEAGRVTSEKRRVQTVEAMVRAIHGLRDAGDAITQVKIAAATGLGIRTVKRRWHNPEVQSELNSN